MNGAKGSAHPKARKKKTKKGLETGGASPVDSRFQFRTIGEMNGYKNALVPSGCITYCLEDKKHYKFVRENDTNLNSGEWQEMGSSGPAGSNIVVISETEFNRLTTKDPQTLYWVYND